AEGAGDGVPVLPMPEELRALAECPSREIQSGATATATAEWASHIASAVSAAGCAMAAIGQGRRIAAAPHALTDLLVGAAADVLRRGAIARVCVEGGATAAALLRRTGWTRLVAVPASLP